jgi:hypothetical protein
MISELIEQICSLRIAVGYLGEKAQRDWWASAFLSADSKTFLSPVFPRTYALAQLHGVTAAAAAVHDERIGVGSVFHLFRLPEDMEESLHGLGHDPIAEVVASVASSEEAALAYLRSIAEDGVKASAGPVRIGQVAGLRRKKSWQAVATHYLSGVENGRETYPFFRDEA